VVAYSTLSQLGYMTVALGASAYASGIFHLATHAFFKALLFLAAGSVIIGLHHEQDIRRMGGLKKYMPVTYWTSLVGSLALIGFPGFAGFFSKDALIEAVGHAQRAGSGYAYICVLIGVFVTALYSFRMFFLVFHGEERIDDDARGHLHESPAVVTVPLILLAIPSVVIGWPLIGPLLFGDFFGDAIFVQAGNDVLAEIGADFHGPFGFLLHGLTSPVMFLAAAGVGTAWYLYLQRPEIPEQIQARISAVNAVLVNKYYFDVLVEKVIPVTTVGLGKFFWRVGDVAIIDGLAVNGSARLVGWVSGIVRRVQTGYLYTYAFAMIIGLSALIGWLLLRT
jgi:NADH-quinone oxidoreductase subunit L